MLCKRAEPIQTELSAELGDYAENLAGNPQHMKKSKIEISLEDAKRNYEPCEKCNPPS